MRPRTDLTISEQFQVGTGTKKMSSNATRAQKAVCPVHWEGGACWLEGRRIGAWESLPCSKRRSIVLEPVNRICSAATPRVLWRPTQSVIPGSHCSGAESNGCWISATGTLKRRNDRAIVVSAWNTARAAKKRATALAGSFGQDSAAAQCHR